MPFLKYAILFLLFIPNIVIAQDSLYLTLDRVIISIKSNDLYLKKNILQAELTEVELQKAKQSRLPQVFIGSTFQDLEGPRLNTADRIFMGIDRQSRWYDEEINFNWDIRKENSELSGNVSNNDRAIEGINVYYQLLSEATQKDILEDLIIEKEDLIQKLKVQVLAGLRLESELMLAQSNRQRLQSQLQDTKHRFKETMAKMLVVSNVKNQVAISFQLADLQLIDLVTMEDLSKRDSKEHPLIIANKRKLISTQKTAEAIKKEWWVPNGRLDLELRSFRAGNTNDEFSGGFTKRIGWEIPILRGGDNAKKTKIAKAEQKLNTLEIEQKALSIAHETIEYQIQLLEAKEEIALSVEGGAVAKKALQQVYIIQETGTGNAYEILQAQEEYIQSMLSYINAAAKYNVLQYRLWVALGNNLYED